mgnify:FL=1
MHAIVATRSDIVHVANFMVNTGKAYWDAVKSILRNLKRTTTSKGFCDSDMVGDVDTHKSTSGYINTLLHMDFMVLKTSENSCTVYCRG